MGFPKQLAEVKDKPLLELVIEKVNSYFESSTVVLGFENEIIEEKVFVLVFMSLVIFVVCVIKELEVEL